MESIIRELWHGNIVPEDDCRERTPKMKQLMEYMAQHHSDLPKKQCSPTHSSLEWESQSKR